MLPKLVRDYIPQKIVKDGKVPVCEFLDDLNVEPYIFNKIKEEVAELQYECTGPELSKERILEEFADVFEILMRLASSYGITVRDINKARDKKLAKHGGFLNNIILTDIIFKGEEKK